MLPQQPTLRPPFPPHLTSSASGQTSTAGSYGFPGEALTSTASTSQGDGASFVSDEDGEDSDDGSSTSSFRRERWAKMAPTPANTVNHDPFGTRSFNAPEPTSPPSSSKHPHPPQGLKSQTSAISFLDPPPHSASSSAGLTSFPSSSSSSAHSPVSPTPPRLPDPTSTSRARARSIQTLPSSTHNLSPLPSPPVIPHSTLPVPPPPTISQKTSWSGMSSGEGGVESSHEGSGKHGSLGRSRAGSTFSKLSSRFGSRVRLLSTRSGGGETSPSHTGRMSRDGGGNAIEMTVSPSLSQSNSHLSPVGDNERGGRGGDAGLSKYEREKKEQLERDQKRLEQLGYSQVLGRDYGFWSCFSISFCNIGFLQGTLSGVLTTFAYGGPSMILTMWPISFLIITLITLSMGELASTYPVAGAMASWAWKCARGGGRGERGWGWLISGVTLGFHVCVMCLLMWQISDLILNIIHLARPESPEASWHVLLLYFAVCFLVGCVGSMSAGRSPRFWVVALVFIVSVWFILCVALLAKGTRTSPSNVFGGKFQNQTGFDSKAMVYILGWVLCTIATGSDGSAHVAEETQNPSRTVPLAMLASVVATYIMGYVSIFILLLAIDPTTIGETMSHPYPTGWILQQSLGLPAAVAISSLVAVAIAFQLVAQLQASSRFVFAIARDDAVPFGQILQRTNSKKMPIIATWAFLSLTLPIGFALWKVPRIAGSVISLGGGTLCLISYAAPIGLYLYSKMDLQTEGRTDWSLRKYSRPVGYAAIFGSFLIAGSMTLPSSSPVTPETFSWSVAVTVGTLLLSWISWKLYGNQHYSGPVKALTRWEAGGEIDLQTTLARTTDVHTSSSLAKYQEDPDKTGYFGPSVVSVPTLPATQQSALASPPQSPGDPDTSMTGLLPDRDDGR